MIGYILNTPIFIVESLGSWTDPITNITYNDFLDKTYEEKKALGWRIVDTSIPTDDDFFTYVEISDWIYNPILDVVKKEYTFVNRSLEEVKMKLLLQLEDTKHLIMGLGFTWNGRGVDSSERSRALINGEYNAALQGVRNEANDVFQFYSGPEHLSNLQVIDIGEKLRNFCQSIYIVLNSFWIRIVSESATIESLKIVKSEIEAASNWPTTYINQESFNTPSYL